MGDSTTTIASSLNRAQTGADPRASTASARTRSIAPGSNQAPKALVKPVVMVEGITEIRRDSSALPETFQPSFEVEIGSENSFHEIIQRARLLRARFGAMPAPTHSAPYGTTEQLFSRLQKAIAQQTILSEEASALLTFWTISTWFPDALSLAPGLAILGPAYEGDLVLNALRNLSRFPLLMTGINITGLKDVEWRYEPTLLCYEPNLTKQMATRLSSSTRRGYLVTDGSYPDFYGPKAIYLGEDVSQRQQPVRKHRVLRGQ